MQLDLRESLGALDDNECRALHERVARAHRLKLDMLILERAQALIESVRKKR